MLGTNWILQGYVILSSIFMLYKFLCKNNKKNYHYKYRHIYTQCMK